MCRRRSHFGRRRTIRSGGFILAVASSLGVVCTIGCEQQGQKEAARLDVERVLGEPGKLPGQFMYPRGIAAGNGQLWVVDKGARVQRLDPETGKSIEIFQTPIFDQGKPTGLTIAPLPGKPGSTGLYVADTHYNRILVYNTADENKAPIAEFGSYGTGPGQFVYPTDIAVLTDDSGFVERIYVSEYGGNDRISIFDADLNYVTSFGSFGVALDHDEVNQGVVFDRPQSIMIDQAKRELIIADSCNHRVGRFTLDGELITWLGTAGEEEFRYPYGLELVQGRGLLVAEYGGNRIRYVDLETGRTLAKFGEPGRELGQLSSPWGVAVIERDAFVLDSGNNRIQVIDSPARALAANGGSE
ncbi:MAG: NHL repeat-containing protein [Phycisphaerales bacterium]